MAPVAPVRIIQRCLLSFIPRYGRTCRLIHSSAVLGRKPTPEQLAANAEKDKQLREDPPEIATNTDLKKKGKFRAEHSVEDSIKYLQSETFQQTYKGYPVWRWYRRNLKMQELWQPKPRTSCLGRHGLFRTNNPCPICKDEYLVLDYRNVELLKMFMIPETDAPLPLLTSGLCQENYRKLEAMIMKAKNHGLILFNVPFRVYDYNEYYPWKDWGEKPQIPQHPEPLDRSQRKSYIKYPVFLPDYRPSTWAWIEQWDKFAKKSYSSY